MSTKTVTQLKTPQPAWAPPQAEPPHLADEDLNLWREVTNAVRLLATDEGWSKGEVSRRSDVPMGTFSPWYDGTYNGNYPNITTRVRNWLQVEKERRAQGETTLREPEFVETPTARECLNALLYAQSMPGIAIITLGAGMGKTSVVNRVLETRPNTFRVTLRPSVKSSAAVLTEVARAVGVASGSTMDLVPRIGDRLKRNGRQTLLMVDEAQNLTDSCVDELRHFKDVYGCGLALLGNEEVYNRWGATTPKEGYGQLHRRINWRLRRLKPLAEDVDTFVAAWGFQDQSINSLLRVIGRKPGALGQITETLRLASIIAAGAKRQLTAADVRAAWENRAGEDMR